MLEEQDSLENWSKRSSGLFKVELLINGRADPLSLGPGIFWPHDVDPSKPEFFTKMLHFENFL